MNEILDTDDIMLLRERGTPEEFSARNAAAYPTPHDHLLYGRGHSERVDEMIQLGNQAIKRWPFPLKYGADLSCGNGAVLKALDLDSKYYGDIAPGHAFHGPVEETINEIPDVNLFVLGETLEHVYDPAALLDALMNRIDVLLLSTPLDCWGDTNAEHYWAWSQKGVEQVASRSGFSPQEFSMVDSTAYGEPYKYGIWVFA